MMSVGILDHAGDRRKFVQHAFDLTAVMAAPSFEMAMGDAARFYRRAPAALKRLRGKPPYFSVSDSSSDARRFGF